MTSLPVYGRHARAFIVRPLPYRISDSGLIRFSGWCAFFILLLFWGVEAGPSLDPALNYLRNIIN